MRDHHGPAGHTAWCARGHHCHLCEHRSTPITVHVPGAGSLILTRVHATTNGSDHAEIRMNITLPNGEPAARLRLAALLTHLRVLIGPARIASAPTASTSGLPGAHR